MTDVEAGGATVFPEIGLSLVPKKVIISVIFYLWVFRLLVSYLDTVCISAGQQQKTGEVFSQSYCWHSMIGYWHHTFVCVSVPCGKTTHPTANVSQQVNWKCPPPDKWVGSAPKEPLYWPYPLKSPYLRKLDFFFLICYIVLCWSHDRFVYVDAKCKNHSAMAEYYYRHTMGFFTVTTVLLVYYWYPVGLFSSWCKWVEELSIWS